ncbi:MAG: arginine deiminase family protein, partial [Solibacillus isronensis]
KEEQFQLGTNVLSIGNKRILSLPVNINVNKQLRDRGFQVIEVDITEIIKSGGSFRCCTLPILREA